MDLQHLLRYHQSRSPLLFIRLCRRKDRRKVDLRHLRLYRGYVATQSLLASRRPHLDYQPRLPCTQGRPGSMGLPAPRLSFPAIATPPNPRNFTSRRKPATPISSSSWTWTGKANPSTSRPLSEPIPYEIALAMAINELLLPNPAKSTSGSKPSTPTSSSSRTSTGEANPRISLPLSEPNPYEIALPKAINASLLSAKEGGIPVSPSAQQSSSWDDRESNTRPSNGLVRNDLAPPISLDSSILYQSAEEVLSSPLIRRGCSNHVSRLQEGARLSSFPLPENVSFCDGGWENRGLYI